MVQYHVYIKKKINEDLIKTRELGPGDGRGQNAGFSLPEDLGYLPTATLAHNHLELCNFSSRESNSLSGL